MFSTMGIAQEKEYKVADDGFEWYKVKRSVNGKIKYGAEDRYGNMIVPTEYDDVVYIKRVTYSGRTFGGGFLPDIISNKRQCAWYNKSGKCVIPYIREYNFIRKIDNDEFGTYYVVEKPDGSGICDKNGKEVLYVKVDGLNYISPSSKTINGKKYYYVDFHVSRNGVDYEGIADDKGEIVVPAEYEKNSTELSDMINRVKGRLTTTNPLAGNGHETQAEADGQPQRRQNIPVAGQERQQLQQGAGTTTIHVEHHRDPVPVQEWQQCVACFGSGQCPYVKCGGSGWYYIGDRASTCGMCHGSGKCSTCAGKGGQYITVYR